MRQHHLVVLAAESGLLVAAEWRVGGVGVVAVHPDTASLDSARNLEELMGISGPDAGAQAVLRVVGDGDGLLGGLEGSGAHHGAEDLLL